MSTSLPLAPPTEDLTVPAAEEQLGRILLSPHFARADTMRKLLRYLWEHRNEAVSEYAIATEGMERSASFDSSADASVRVQISRLRRKLKDYYGSEVDEPELLQIPTGTHQLVVLESAPVVRAKLELIDSAIKPAKARDYSIPLLGCGCALLMFVVAGLLWKNHQLGQREPSEQQMNSFWSAYLSGDAAVKIILPTPVFFGFEDADSIRVRSTEVNSFDEKDTNPEFKRLTAKLGRASLEQSYTVTSDTLAAIDMARYLDSVGQTRRVTFDVTRDASLNVLEHANVVAVGTHATLYPFRDYLASMNFDLAKGETWVDNAHPTAGEAGRYMVRKIARNRKIEPSIVALLPGRGPGLKLLIMASRHTGALVSLLTSSVGSNTVEGMLASHGSPKYFEMVVLTECEGNTAVRSWPVALHAYTKQAPSGTM